MKKLCLLVFVLLPLFSNGQIITTIAGVGIGGPLGDGGPATAANWGGGAGIAIDKFGAVIIADPNRQRVRKIDQTTGIITTIAGNGTTGFSGDGGSATAATFDFPGWIACDTSGNLFISDGENERVRKVNPAGIVSTIVGTGIAGFSGDGGPATAAQLINPSC